MLAVVVDPGPDRSGMEIVCDSHDDLALGFTPDALPETTLTIYPGLVFQKCTDVNKRCC